MFITDVTMYIKNIGINTMKKLSIKVFIFNSSLVCSVSVFNYVKFSLQLFGNLGKSFILDIEQLS